MPDQSSAATEHAIIQEITAPLEHLPDDPIAIVRADFPSALRGYDRMAVDAYVQQVSQLVAELQATRSPEAAVRRALERVGDQITGILQRAHDTAEQITAQSRAEAEDRLQQARGEARELVAAAQQHVSDLDADTDRIWIERGRIVDDTRELARQLQSVADTAGEAFPEPGLAHATGETAALESDAEAAETAIEPAPEDETRAFENVEATVRYDPLPPEPDVEPEPDAEPEPAGEDAPTEPRVRGTRAAIPPASQAASRRRRD